MAKFSLRKINKDLTPLRDLFSEGELVALSKHGTIIDIAPGQILMEEGTTGSEVAIVVAGQAKITQDDEFVANAEVGDFLGEQAVLANKLRAFSVCAVTILKLSALSIEAFAKILTESDDFRRRLDQQVQGRAA